MCLVEEGRFGFSFVLWADSRKCPGEGGRGFKESPSSAEGPAQLRALGAGWALCSLGRLFQGCSTFIADNSAWMPWPDRQRCSLLICFPHGRKFTNRAAATGWKISIRWLWPSGAPLQMMWLQCGNCVVLVKLGFVNLLRCLDGWLATDFIGQY